MLKRKKELFLVVALFAVVAFAAAVALPGYSRSAAGEPQQLSAQELTPASLGTGAAKKADPNATAKKAEEPTAASDAATAKTLPAAATTTDAPPAATNAHAAPANGTANAPTAGAAYAAAARQNLSLRTGLDWTFGGKQQRGWWLYEQLIARTLEAEGGAASGGFAESVARWQQSAGLPATGTLDRETWMRLVGHWQSRRLGSSAYPSADKLVTVSASEFYDPARPAELRQVERETYAAYRRMLAAAAADPASGLKVKTDGSLDESEKFFRIVSAFRSKEYQERLRKADPKAGRAGLARHSPHFTGRALDLYVGGYDPVSTKDDNRALQVQTKAYQWLVRNAERFGFRPYYYEPWHWEYVGN